MRTDWLVGWLIDWLIDWLTCPSVGGVPHDVGHLDGNPRGQLSQLQAVAPGPRHRVRDQSAAHQTRRGGHGHARTPTHHPHQVCRYGPLSVCLSVSLSVCVSVWIFVWRSVCPSVHLSVFLYFRAGIFSKSVGQQIHYQITVRKSIMLLLMTFFEYNFRYNMSFLPLEASQSKC